MNQNENQIKPEAATHKPLAGNKQNTGYQLKSWHIAVVGIIIELLSTFVITNRLTFYALFLVYAGFLASLIIFLIIIGVPVLLYFKKTAKIGASVGLIFGSIKIIIQLSYFFANIEHFLTYGGIIDLAFLLAGIHYFWKKV